MSTTSRSDDLSEAEEALRAQLQVDASATLYLLPGFPLLQIITCNPKKAFGQADFERCKHALEEAHGPPSERLQQLDGDLFLLHLSVPQGAKGALLFKYNGNPQKRGLFGGLLANYQKVYQWLERQTLMQFAQEKSKLQLEPLTYAPDTPQALTAYLNEHLCRLQGIFGLAYASIWMFDRGLVGTAHPRLPEEAGHAHQVLFIASAGAPPPNQRLLEVKSNLWEEILRTKSFVHIPDVKTDSRYQPRHIATALDLRELFSFPVTDSSRTVFAVLNVYPCPGATLLADDRNELQAWANAIGYRLAAERSKQHERTLSALISALSQLTPVKADLEEALADFASAMGIKLISMVDVPFGSDRARLRWTSDKIKKHADLQLIEQSTVLAVSDVREPLRIPSLELLSCTDQTRGLWRGCSADGRIESLLVFPLFASGDHRLLGYLLFADRQNGLLDPYFSEAETSSLSHLARFVALKLENDYLQEAARQLALIRERNVENIQHELTNPIEGISQHREWFAKKLLLWPEGQLRQSAEHKLDDIQLGCDLMETQVKGFRWASKSLPPARPSRIELPKLVFATAKMLKGEAAERAVRVFVLPPGVRWVYADRTQIPLLFFNLIRNAIKYSDKNEHDRYLNIAARTSGDYVELCFEDNGIGILEADRKRIFERYERGTNATTTNVTGSGLGLWISARIAGANGGKLELVSLSKPCIFSVTLPLCRGKENVLPR